MVFAVIPAHAFTAKTLTITLSSNGDAKADIQYDLSWAEQAAVFFRIADPADELEKGLESGLNKAVTVTSVTSSTAEVTIPSFAYVSKSGESGSLVTPAFSFTHVQDAVNHYWFAKLISPNFTPQTTTIIFPDGYRASYKDKANIPTIAHRLTH